MAESKKTIDELIAELRAESAGADDTVTRLVRMLREAGDVEHIVALLGSEESALREVGVRAAHPDDGPRLHAPLAALASDPKPKVRLALAARLAQFPAGPLDEALATLCQDREEGVRRRAIQSTGGRQSLHQCLVERLRDDEEWEVRQDAARALLVAPTVDLAAPIVDALIHEHDGDVAEVCLDVLEKLLQKEQNGKFLEQAGIAGLERIASGMRGMSPRRYAKLGPWVREYLQEQVNPETLRNFGVDLTEQAGVEALPRAYGVDKVCTNLEEALLGPNPSSVVLLGEAGVGKTAIVQELAHRLSRRDGAPWRVLRVSPSDMLIGTKYIGEWETKLKSLVDAIKRPRRVILYIPNIGDLNSIGQHSRSTSNVANALAPQLEDGSVLVIGESTDESFESGLGASPALRRLFKVFKVIPATRESTLGILRRVRDKLDSEVSDDLLGELAELASYYMSGVARPGNAVGLLRSALHERAEDAPPLTSRVLLEAISRSTGLPVDLVDDSVSLNLARIREFFDSRVMGQNEAVSTVCNLVTLIKAGLTDPERPFGVLLFVGPTGVGKTELARSLAEYIFGDAARLHRLDMSEFASFDGFERLIGGGNRDGLLTEPVRQEPFSVVLLDEIEKSHINVFDLLLQVFDAGRLTDGRGRTVSFARTIVIMTSNVGARSPNESRVGFGGGEVPVTDRDDTQRGLAEVFRPEFLNRIDHVIQFQPLSLEVAESIARREVQRMLGRSGISRRHLAIDVDPGIFALLVQEGYSVHLGARPLKRAVERCVLLPVARAIATGKIPERGVLRLRRDGNDIRVEIDAAPPTADDEKDLALPPPPGLATLRERVTALLSGLDELAEQTQPIVVEKEQLLALSRAPEFWDQPAHAQRVLSEVHRIDQLLRALGGLRKVVTRLERRVAHDVPELEQPKLRERLDELHTELEQLAAIAACEDGTDLRDAVISITVVDSRGDGLDGVEKLARMYLGLARRRHLSGEVIAEYPVSDPREGSVHLRVTGLGAYGLLRGEAGLHQFASREDVDDARGRERRRLTREVVRVEIFPVPDENGGAPTESELKVKVLSARDREPTFLKKAEYDISLFHPRSLVSVRAWVPGPRDEAVSRVMLLLRVRTESPPPATEAPDDTPPIIRRYDLGQNHGVKDLRTGKHTPYVARVLRGQLDPFLQFRR